MYQRFLRKDQLVVNNMLENFRRRSTTGFENHAPAFAQENSELEEDSRGSLKM